ncbi:transposase [Chitinophaga polysaccharea]|uniref:transposase n=1 Tax=Chitinophaga polysaccharea TaxID=1293035 RepID=UPI001159B167|nr:transposase [Chitinophaga polysaccharea]
MLPKENKESKRQYKRELYKVRNVVEREINKLKHYRRIATEYYKKARNSTALPLPSSTQNNSVNTS